MFIDILQKIGFTPTKNTQNGAVYKSPWNTEERTPSFFIFQNEQWNGQDPLKEFNYKDNSSGHGGDIYNFMMTYFNLDFKLAKQKLSELMGSDCQEQPRPMPTFSPNQRKKEKSEKQYKIIKTSTLENQALINYLEERGLSELNLHKRFVGEIYYEIDAKRYFAISFGNDSGGREIRNKYFKGSFGKKDISLILPNPNDKRLKIFEGFIDFLSYLEISKTAPLSNYLILNSVSLRERALRAIESKFEVFELYLDNDRAGNETTDFFMQNFNNSIDKRVHYKEYKDLNEFLVNWRQTLIS